MFIRHKKARETRDAILDCMVAGDRDGAVRLYREATGAPSAEAEQMVARLHRVLNEGDGLSVADQQFLDGFRDRLARDRTSELLDQPHPALPKQLAALASYALLALLTMNILLAVILLVSGGLGAWVNTWLGFTVGILLAGPMFIVLPGVLRGLLVRRLGIGHFVRSPGFGWEIALGFVLLLGGVLGTVVSERMWWAARAEVVALETPDELATVEVDRSDIVQIGNSWVPDRLAGTHVETRRQRQGGVTRSEYVVRPLLGPRPPADGRVCWWVGKASSGFGPFQHPVLELDGPSPFFVDNPAHREPYEAAVANALGRPAPDCARIFERVPSPEVIRADLAGKLRGLAVGVNIAAWVLLTLWAAAWAYRRFRSA
ncbi:MAG: hypothetical protein AAGM22_07230 [Acidobacteriota bacterium]